MFEPFQGSTSGGADTGQRDPRHAVTSARRGDAANHVLFVPVTTADNLESAVATATSSYERCQQAGGFFPTFYEQLLASDPSIPPMFAKTEFPKQHKLLQHGLGLLLSFARRRNPGLLERLANRHGPADLDIPRVLYPKFVFSLLEAVRIHDRQWGPDVEAAWRTAVEPGLRFMSEHGR